MIPGPPLPVLEPPWSARVPSGEADLELIRRWNAEPHVTKFWHQDWPLKQWRAELKRQLDGQHSLPCLIARDGVDVAYLEIYRVTRDVLADRCEHEPHDLGVHIAIGDPTATGRGLGRAVLHAVAEGLLAVDPQCTQVLAEPDADNLPSLRAFAAAGFVELGAITLPDKTAVLMARRRTP